MTSKTVTVIVTVLSVLGLIGYDLGVTSNGVQGDSISAVVLETSYSWWSIPFSCGMIGAHLFAPRQKSIIGLRSTTMLPIAAGSMLALNLASTMLWGGSEWLPGVAAVLGAAFGRYCWPNLGNKGE